MEVIRKTHANGLRSLIVQSPDAETVTVMFLVRVGSRFETADEKGLAHFLEHTIFKGTDRRPSSKQIGMEIESLGGSSNAFTSYDYTGYYIKAPAQNFRASFDILQDMFLHSQYSEAEINKERGVIVEEIRMYEDRPAAKVSQAWTSNYFQGNTLGLDITGTIDSVKGMRTEQFKEFQQKHYYPENVLFVAAGKVEEAEVEELLGGIMGQFPTAPDQRSQFEQFSLVEIPERSHFIRIQKEVEQAHLLLGGKALERDHDQRFPLQVLNTMLGSGFGSRLFQVIRDELGLAYYVYSRLSSFTDHGIFQVGLGVDPSRVDEAVSAVQRELGELLEGRYTEDEFTRARNFLLGNLVTDLETSEDVAMFYGMQEILDKEKLSIAETRERIMAVQLPELQDIAKQIFREDNYYWAQLSR